ncbi:MAG: ABC transporter substrate-binding protein [Ktedonobacteraceae bacterium]|nr:ABC transporter substrate-binding protein [Ktedonobacteraceae bacterium]
MGSNPSYADTVVAQQIVNVAGHFAVKGVMGWPGLTASSQAVSILNQANIPIVSPARYNTLDTAPNLFHSIPSNETEGMLDATYAEQNLHAHTILVSYTLGDSSSLGLESGFMQQLKQDGVSDVLATPIAYASCTEQNATMNCEDNLFTPLLEKAMQVHPDLIVFTGNASDGNILLKSLARIALPSTPRVLGRGDLYQLADNSVFESPYIQHLFFTSFAYYEEESVMKMMKDYAASFDVGDSLPPVRAYGYSKPDNDVIFSYNAMLVLVASIDSLPSPVTPFSPSDVQQVLAQEQVPIIGAQQLQTMTFDNLHEPKNVGLLVLQVGSDESIQPFPTTVHS